MFSGGIFYLFGSGWVWLLFGGVGGVYGKGYYENITCFACENYRETELLEKSAFSEVFGGREVC